MRVFVTGSSGQLGAEVTRQLAGHDIVGLDLVPSPTTTHTGSVTDRGLVLALAAGADAIVHTASLHAPHVGSRSKQDFIDVNVTGTLNLLEAAVACHARRFVYTSTTSVYGHSLELRERAAWVTEELIACPRDIYDVTKLAAEELCKLHADRLAVTCLRVSRFFDEEPRVRAIHRLYRGGDVRDMAAAHVRAIEGELPFETGPLRSRAIFNISARSAFAASDLEELLVDAPAVIARRYPEVPAAFARRGWALPPSIDRVYVIEKAEWLLGFSPIYGIADLVD